MSHDGDCAALSAINILSDGALVTVRGYSAGLFKKALNGEFSTNEHINGNCNYVKYVEKIGRTL
jgi:hypothetical protein